MKNILIVDDNPQNLYMLQTLLSGNGYGVMGAANGAEALEKARSERPDMIIADILMPVMDGFQLCREWKRDGRLKDVPFMFYTATYTDPEDEKFALGLGAERFIVKPQEPEAFLGILKEVFEAHKAGRLAAPCEPQHDEAVYFKEYNEVLIRKLENKMVQVEEAKRCLEREVAAHIRTEEALRESEERYRSLIENINLGITLIGTDYRILMTNTGEAKLFNKPASAFRGKQCFREFEKRNEVCPHCPGTIAIATGRTGEAETTGIRDDGGSFSVHLYAFPVFEQNGEISGFIEVVEDITERKRAEEQMLSLQAQLQQSQKMEAIGRLAGGVAHDFNNLLTVISIQSELSRLGLQKGDPLKENLKEIEKAADRAADLTRQLLAFSRRQILEMKVLNLNFIVSDLEKMLHRIIGEDFELASVLADDLGMVKVDPGQMEQVIVNLAVNAKDAMPEGGKLTIETTNVDLDEGYTQNHLGVVPGAYVMLSVSDNGVGMSREVKAQIFDPFFTTKEKGKGTGLGLSTVYGIVKQSGGDILVYSEPNQGTAFKIYFPRVFEPGEELAKKEAVGEVPRGSETILVVEDDSMVRKLAVDILRTQGYTVLEAEAGGEALLISEQYKEPIHLILTDVVMPHMSGAQFIERLKQTKNDFKVLYMTGYSENAITHHGLLEKGLNLIPKPFTIEKLARKVREVLDGS